MIIFWRAYFVYQRGQTPDNREKLFELVAKKANNAVFKWPSYFRKVWEQEHDQLLKSIEDCLQKYAEQWIESPAGKRYDQYVKDQRFTYSVAR